MEEKVNHWNEKLYIERGADKQEETEHREKSKIKYYLNSIIPKWFLSYIIRPIDFG